jgi:WhiB family redox-sensing transcriptional regulator
MPGIEWTDTNRSPDLDAIDRLLYGRPDWHDEALCKGKTASFFTDAEDGIELAKAVCFECPVRLRCLEAGLREPFGIWGGLTPRERRRELERRRRAA